MINGRSPGGQSLGTAATDAAPVPELLVVDQLDEVLSAFVGDAPPARPEAFAPTGEPTGNAEVISDDERNRFGVLLDRAAERGLLTPREYELRLADLAAATSVEQMREIVTVLPSRDAPAPRPSRSARSRGRATAVDGVAPLNGGADRRSSPWLVLALVVLALVVAMAFFAVYAEHLAHVHSSGPSPRELVLKLSALRS